MSTELGTYKGRDIVSVAMALRNAGDGLSEAMQLEPVELEIGQRVHIVMEAVVDQHRLVPAIKGDVYGPLQIVAGLRAEAAKIVDNPTVAKLLDKHKAQLNRAKEIEGQRSIEDDLPDEGF